MAGHDLRAPVSFTLQHGQAIAVVGWNGVGKSTLLRGIAGIASVSGGRIEVNGEALGLRSINDRFRHGIAYVGQVPALPGREHAWDDAVSLAFGARPGLYNEVAIAYLKARLTSLGWVQGERVSADLFDLVVAILSAPSIIILDEVDARLQRQLGAGSYYKTIRDLIPASAVVFVEHNIELALRIADWVLVLDPTKPATVLRPSDAESHLLSSSYDELPSASPVENSYYKDAERLLEMDSSPKGLLRRCLTAGGVKLVRQWTAQIASDWQFTESANIEQLSGGERVILASLASAASRQGLSNPRLIGHIYPAYRQLLRKYVRVLESDAARASRPPSPVKQLTADE